MASRSPEIPLSGGAGVYQFTKAMDTLEAGLDDKTWLILSTDSDLLRYLKGPERK